MTKSALGKGHKPRDRPQRNDNISHPKYGEESATKIQIATIKWILFRWWTWTSRYESWSGPAPPWILTGWWLSPTPLKNDGLRQLGWWQPQYMESHKIPWFQSPPTSLQWHSSKSKGSSKIAMWIWTEFEECQILQHCDPAEFRYPAKKTQFVVASRFRWFYICILSTTVIV